MDAELPRGGGRLIRGKELHVYRPQIASPTEKPPSVTPRVEVSAIPGPKLQASKEKEQRRIESYFEKQQRRVESEQRKELRDAQPGTDPEQLRRRHEEERRALEEQKQRELKVREQRLEKRIVKPGRKTKQENVAGSK